MAKMLSPTSRAYVLIAVAAAFAATSFLTEPGLAVATASAATFVILLVVASYASLNAQVGAMGRLKIERKITKPLIEGEKAKISVEIRNDTSIPVELLEIKIPYPRSFKLVEGSSTVLLVIPPKSKAEAWITVKPRIGRHVLEPPKVVARDFLGLFRFEASIGFREEIRVLPKVAPVREFRVVYSSRPGGMSRAKKRGHGVEFFGIREYVPGDEYRRIEWKSSARYGMERLFVKEFEHEVSLNVFMIIDTSLYSLSGMWGRTPLEYSVRAAASIAAYAAWRGDAVAIAHPFSKPPRLVRGRKALSSAMMVLSSIPWDEILAGNARPVASYIRWVLPKVLPRERNTVILFTVLYGGKKEALDLVKALSKVKEAGNVVMVIVPMVEAFEVRTLKGFEAAVYRVRTFQAIKERIEAINTLIKHGIPAVTALPEELTEVVVRRLEHIRSSLT